MWYVGLNLTVAKRCIVLLRGTALHKSLRLTRGLNLTSVNPTQNLTAIICPVFVVVVVLFQRSWRCADMCRSISFLSSGNFQPHESKPALQITLCFPKSLPLPHRGEGFADCGVVFDSNIYCPLTIPCGLWLLSLKHWLLWRKHTQTFFFFFSHTAFLWLSRFFCFPFSLGAVFLFATFELTFTQYPRDVWVASQR